MCRRGQVRKQQRLRVRHGVPDVKMVVLSRHKTLTADLMTQVLSHAIKNHVCGSAECAQVWCSVYTPRRLQGNRIACKRNTLQLGERKEVHSSSQLDACHHFSDDCHHDEDEPDEVAEEYHFHPVFGS